MEQEQISKERDFAREIEIRHKNEHDKCLLIGCRPDTPYYGCLLPQEPLQTQYFAHNLGKARVQNGYRTGTQLEL
jgi:hypothetical protein